MKINEVIRRYRKKENLTQEQIASCLNVSASAVNKWENGNSYPDITLLAPLSRILKINIDTLLSFNEELTKNEIDKLIKELSELIFKEGFDKGFEFGSRLIKEYPYCDELILNIAEILNANFFSFKKSNTNSKVEMYENSIIAYYNLVSGSNDTKIAFLSRRALVVHYIEKKQFEKSQKILNQIEPIEIEYDKIMLQAMLLKKQGKYQESLNIYKNRIHKIVGMLISTLQFCCRLLCDENKYEEGEYYAILCQKLGEILDLSPIDKYIMKLTIYAEKQDKEKTIEVLESLVNDIKFAILPQESKLYSDVEVMVEYAKLNLNTRKVWKDMIKENIENNEKFEFIRNDTEVKKLMQELEI